MDIATPADDAVQRMRRLVERLAENKDVLTVVCGRTNDRMAEIWARELGVWAHLPGVAPESDWIRCCGRHGKWSSGCTNAEKHRLPRKRAALRRVLTVRIGR